MNGQPIRGGRKSLRAGVMALAALAITTWGQHSWAGTAEDPEITSDCGGSTVPTTEKLDICSGWFRGIWVEGSEVGEQKDWTLQGIETFLTLDAPVQVAPEHGGYSMSWSLGDCRQVWLLFREADAAGWTLLFHHDCPDADESFGVVLPPERLTIQANRIGVRLLVDEELAPIRSQLSVGSAFVGPSAASWINLATDPTGAITVEWDATDPGRTFVLGQDMPAA